MGNIIPPSPTPSPMPSPTPSSSVTPSPSVAGIGNAFSVTSRDVCVRSIQPRCNCIGFPEKVFKLGFGFILECGRLGSCFHADSGICFGPDLDPLARNHNERKGTLPSGYRSLNTSGDASQSFQIMGPHFFSLLGEGLIGTLVFPQS